MGRKQKQETSSATLFRMHLVRNLSFLIFLLFSLCWSSSSSLTLFFFCQPCPFHKTTTLCICGLDMEDVFSCSCQFSSCGLTIERSRRRSPALINRTSLFVIWLKNAEKCLHNIDLWSLIFVFSDIEKSGFDFFFFFSFTHSFSRRLYWRFAHNRLCVLSKFDWQLKAQRAASERKKWVRCRKRFKREHCSFVFLLWSYFETANWMSFWICDELTVLEGFSVSLHCLFCISYAVLFFFALCPSLSAFILHLIPL